MKVKNDPIANLRQDYTMSELNEADVLNNPIEQFRMWFNDAVNAEVFEPNVMTLATTEKNGRPSARIVLLKGIEPNGFTFFTNYLSRKGKEIKKNPFGSLVFLWANLERQVRIEGKIEKLDKETSEAYFNSRPLDSQIGSIISPQSQPIPSRIFLEEKFNTYKKEHEGETLNKPAHWGGYILIPDKIEFWQGRSGRLHDRLSYSLKGKNWVLERLAP